VRLMESDSTVLGPVNIGNPVESTMIELAELVLELTGSKSSMIYLPLPIDDPRHRCPNITVAREMLGWEPKVSLQDGLVRAIGYFEQMLGKQRISVK
jgi:UDP-glucuronate decarboxylase